MERRPLGRPSPEEAAALIASYLRQDQAPKMDTSSIAHLVNLPEELVARDLENLRRSPPLRRLFVDQGGILSAAIAISLIFCGVIARHCHLIR